MGGLLRLFDANLGDMARKILAHKQPVDGFEAPRNSLELQVEAYQNCYDAGDGLYSYEINEDWSEKTCYPVEASMKRLINDEIGKQSTTRKNAPSIVARLMGVDMLPLDTKAAVQPIGRKKESSETKFAKKEKSGRRSVTSLSTNSFPSMPMELDSLYPSKRRDGDGWNKSQTLEKPRPREHPQEEELQKFKKEFEAWQAARFKECSKVAEVGRIPHRFSSQDDIDKRKVVLDADDCVPTVEKSTENKALLSKARAYERVGSQHPRHKMELFPSEQEDGFPSRNNSKSRNFEHSFMNYNQSLDNSSAPTNIVVLKPGPDRISVDDGTWTCSSGTLEERGSIEDFLQEVKERLKCELQGKAMKKGSAARGSGIETPFRERPADPKQIAQNIAKQVRESVSRDIRANLVRSESTRSYRSEIQFNGSYSPEFINRDTRRYLSERLRNVLKRETLLDVPIVVSGSSRSSLLGNEKARQKKMGGNMKAGNEPSYWEIVKDEQEMQTRSFRHGGDDGAVPRELSPRNLIRSLSAPVSGTSFGQLLLEDRHILTGAQIRRKHEALGNVTLELKKHKKERFNIKEKVSNFRYSISLRSRLFAKKIQSVVDTHNCKYDLVRDITSGPTVVMNYGNRYMMENSTEVPPSPASVCSSAQEEFWRQTDYLSPMSTPDITVGEDDSMPQVFKEISSNLNVGEDDSMPQVFKEISSNLNALRRQLHQLGSYEPEDAIPEEEPAEDVMVDLGDKAEAYIRDLLVASGLYDGSSDKSLSRWDPLARPLSTSVFDEVEKAHIKSSQDDEITTKEQHEGKADRRLLFDLLNETLSTVLGPAVTMSRFRRKLINSSMQSPLHGRRLLDCLWKIITEYLYPLSDKCCYSLDGMVVSDLESSPWSGLVDEEVHALGKEMEFLIIGDLINEVVNDMHC